MPEATPVLNIFWQDRSQSAGLKNLNTFMSNTEDGCAESTRLGTCRLTVKTEIIQLHFLP